MHYRDIENDDGPDCPDVLKYSFEFVLKNNRLLNFYFLN